MWKLQCLTELFFSDKLDGNILFFELIHNLAFLHGMWKSDSRHYVVHTNWRYLNQVSALHIAREFPVKLMFMLLMCWFHLFVWRVLQLSLPWLLA